MKSVTVSRDHQAENRSRMNESSHITSIPTHDLPSPQIYLLKEYVGCWMRNVVTPTLLNGVRNDGCFSM